jgi:hypothetical protein
MTLLPSPTEVSPTHEIIWSEDTGRAQSGVDKAKMIGSPVAEKQTYAIKWDMLQDKNTHEPVPITAISNKLTKGFFYFGIGSSLSAAQANAKKFYRSEIQYELLPVWNKTEGDELYYKNVSVSVIEQ